MQMIMYVYMLFPALSIAYVMLIKMYYGWHKSLQAKWLNELS